MFFVDSHCHVDLLNYSSIHSGIDDVLKKSIDNNIKLLLTVSTSIHNFHYVKKFIKNHENILLSCGIHPLHLHEDKNNIKNLEFLCKDDKVIAIGETGLDYHHKTCDHNTQQSLFRKHVQLAIKLNKPLLIHTRHSINDTINILKEERTTECTGIIHSFSENIHFARKILDMGFYISFSGIITFKNADYVRQVVKFAPLESILLETDSPYLTPVPYRGQENQPAFLCHTALLVSKLKNISIDELAEHTTQNFFKLFQLKLKLKY
ncbi:MAG: YchF/TatD family DNA exonuclease [Buchnera aphidicola (Schlechtendalia peitan)]